MRRVSFLATPIIDHMFYLFNRRFGGVGIETMDFLHKRSHIRLRRRGRRLEQYREQNFAREAVY